MSSSAQEKATGADGDSRNPIHFSEAYRRAKRNALLWAASAGLLAIGVREGQPIRFAGFVQNIEIPSFLALSLALFGLTVMTGGYIRADLNLGFLNANAVIEKRKQEIVNIFDGLSESVKRISSAISDGESKILQWNEIFERADQESDESVFNAAEQLHEQVDQILNGLQKEAYSEGYTSSERRAVIERSIAALREVVTRTSVALKDARTRLAGLSRVSNEGLFEVSAALKRTAGKIDELETRVERFGSQLDRRERWFFNILDRGVVGGACIGAFALAAMRFSAGDTLDSWLGRDESFQEQSQQIDYQEQGEEIESTHAEALEEAQP